MTNKSVRTVAVGVLLDDRIQEVWTIECLRQCFAVPGVTLTALALARLRPRRSLAVRLHHLFDRLDERTRCRGERLFAAADVVAELALSPLQIGLSRHGNHWRPDEAGIAMLERCEVDLWLCFSAIPPSRLPRSVSRLGAWGIEIGDGVSATNVWAGAAETGVGCPVTMVSIVDYAEAGDDLLYQSYGATVGNSPRRNRLRALQKGVSFFRRLLERQMLAPDSWPPQRPATLPAPLHHSKLPAPTVSALARLAWRLGANWVAHRLPSSYKLEQWQIAYYFSDEEDQGRRFERLRYMVPPKDRFWADPIAVEHEGRYFIFFEELPYDTQKGRVMVVEVFEDAEPGAPQVALERPYHLSYPFVFNWNGSMYMLPETAENNTVELYRSESFPLGWNLHQVLLENIRAFDASLWRQDDRWWMFANVAEPEADSCDELHLYSSTTPLGPWKAHRSNPVVSDVRFARPAGPLFLRGKKLYRPSQDCSVAYGHSILINRVESLTDDTYRETQVDRIAPGWKKDILRVHTVGASKRLRVVDCIVRR